MKRKRPDTTGKTFAVAPMIDWTDVAKNVTKSIIKGFGIREVVPSLYFLELVSSIPMELRGSASE